MQDMSLTQCFRTFSRVLLNNVAVATYYVAYNRERKPVVVYGQLADGTHWTIHEEQVQLHRERGGVVHVNHAFLRTDQQPRSVELVFEP
jgi:hypothetical protein